ncbi:MAG: hypothetical protein JWR09_262 [Mucilaginibacter sp.]|nr:hypothetical protein [Mucilaginibacter sp.]
MPFQFKIQIADIQKPRVWRRVIVSEDLTFDIFHQIIQAAFGWGNCHMYQFSKQGWASYPIYKIPEDYDDEGMVRDSMEVKLSEVFSKPKETFTYIYDFGDTWKHQILLEKIIDEKILMPMCTAGKGACPPEDCGGVYSYYDLLDILDDPKHHDHKEMRKWLGLSKGQQWDVNAFDINEVNDRLKLVELSE